VPAVNLLDELFVVADPESIRVAVCDPRRWARWLPGIVLAPYQDRERLGVRWTVSGELIGTAEVWLEEHGDGTIVHAYLRADPASRARRRRSRSPRLVATHYALPLKRGLFSVKDALEGSRRPGTVRVALGERVVSASDGGQAGEGTEGAPDGGRPDQRQHPDLR
jgi:hypothetical protein